MLKNDVYLFMTTPKCYGGGDHVGEKSIYKKFPDLQKELVNIKFPDYFTFRQKIYHWFFDDITLKIGTCPTCGKRCSFLNLKSGYHEYCSCKCSGKSNKTKEKRKITNITKYGVEHNTQTENYKKKYKETCLTKYGVENPSQSEYVKEKKKETYLTKYGVENPSQSEYVKEKKKETCLAKYGVEFSLQSEIIKNKSKISNKEKYGVEYPMQSEIIKNKSKISNKEKYGVEYPMQSEIIKNKSKETCLKKYGVFYSAQSEQVKEKTRKTNKEKYGVEWFCMHPNARLYSSNNSKPNLCFEKKLKENNISYEREFPLVNYSYDFKIGNTLVEINPTITHNSYLNIFGGEPHKSDYHLNKSNTAKENGFHCIHIWDWDDEDKIVNLLKPKKTLYARNLSLMEVDEKTANIFLNKNHLQNMCRGQLIRIGLFLDGELVQLMTFGKPRYNKNYEWELLRLCSHSDYIVVGGSEKLFNYFIKTHKPKSVISYCDLSKFTGNVYKKLGFVLANTAKPSKHWWDGKTHITDNLLRQRGFDQLFNANYGKGTNNEELMLEHKFLPVYDCGQSVWVYKQ